jgi:hypothetical protein
MKPIYLKSNKAQASLEYILLILVIVSVAVPLFKTIEQHVVTNPNSMLNTFLASYRQMFGGDQGGVSLQYKRFTLKR